MSPDEFRKQGRQVIDLIADYMENVESYPVLSQVAPKDIYNQLPPNPPIHGEPFENVMEDVNRIILPGLTHWQSPNFFAYFPTHASGPSILGDLLSSGFGIQGMLWSTSPACTELETLVLDWMVEIAGLPQRFRSSSTGGGVIQDSASSASLCAIVAARERILQRHSNIASSSLIAYVSGHTHSSVEKGLKIAGIESSQIRRIDTDENFAMLPFSLKKAIQADQQNGSVPFFVCATMGTTSSLAFDPLPEIGEIANAENLWFHVDGAHAGSAAVCPEFRWILSGLETADSYCFNPHKWLLTNFDCDLLYVADRNALVDALTFSPEYLKNKASESGEVYDYNGWQISLGRRFRSLKLWFVIRHYGVEGLRVHIRMHCQLATEFANWIEVDNEFELFQPPILNLVLFHHKAGNKATQSILESLNQSGKLFLTHTVLNDTYVIRFSIGAIWTEKVHVEAAWNQIKLAASGIDHQSP